MSFYLKPPRGEANLHTIMECVQQRIHCYSYLDERNDIRNIAKFEYLIEGCTLDRTSHFIFRLGVLQGYLPKKVFLDNELLLFKQRLEAYDKDDMKDFLKNMVRQLRDCMTLNLEKPVVDFYLILYRVACVMVKKRYLSHIFEEHLEHCEISSCNDAFRISIPFWYCTDYVASREVDLKNGNTLFNCSKWKDIILTLFNAHLKIVLNEMKYSNNVAVTLTDERISGCLELLKNQYTKNNSDSGTKVYLKNIEKESVHFPLCMKNLYDSLRKNHRLSHNDRFDFSLFLKGIGLSLNDSLKFWQGEYSLQHSSCSKCSHTWQKNEGKYVYSIRHLYGLEGSRRNYSIKTCQNLQSSGLGINCEGGCPFVHYDDDHMRASLKKNLPGCDDEIEVIIFERKENASIACKLYGECTLKLLKLESQIKDFENPLQYFNLMKKDNKLST